MDVCIINLINMPRILYGQIEDAKNYQKKDYLNCILYIILAPVMREVNITLEREEL